MVAAAGCFRVQPIILVLINPTNFPTAKPTVPTRHSRDLLLVKLQSHCYRSRSYSCCLRGNHDIQSHTPKTAHRPLPHPPARDSSICSQSPKFLESSYDRRHRSSRQYPARSAAPAQHKGSARLALRWRNDLPEEVISGITSTNAKFLCPPSPPSIIGLHDHVVPVGLH